MRVRRWLLIPLTLVFAAVSTWAVYEHGYLNLWKLVVEHSGTLQLFTDLSVSMLLVCTWMVRDARQRGLRVAPFLLLTLATGSLGPLAYLWRLELWPAEGAA